MVGGDPASPRLKRGVDLDVDFQDYKGPLDTGSELDRVIGKVMDPVIRLDYDYPNIPRELGSNPTRAKVLAMLQERQRARGLNLSLYGFRFRSSASGNLHVEIDLSGEYMASEVVRIRSLMGDDDFRVLCDSRRALKNPIYLGGYLHESKWMPRPDDKGKMALSPVDAGRWESA